MAGQAGSDEDRGREVAVLTEEPAASSLACAGLLAAARHASAVTDSFRLACVRSAQPLRSRPGIEGVASEQEKAVEKRLRSLDRQQQAQSPASRAAASSPSDISAAGSFTDTVEWSGASVESIKSFDNSHEQTSDGTANPPRKNSVSGKSPIAPQRHSRTNSLRNRRSKRSRYTSAPRLKSITQTVQSLHWQSSSQEVDESGGGQESSGAHVDHSAAGLASDRQSRSPAPQLGTFALSPLSAAAQPFEPTSFGRHAAYRSEAEQAFPRNDTSLTLLPGFCAVSASSADQSKSSYSDISKISSVPLLRAVSASTASGLSRSSDNSLDLTARPPSTQPSSPECFQQGAGYSPNLTFDYLRDTTPASAGFPSGPATDFTKSKLSASAVAFQLSSAVHLSSAVSRSRVNTEDINNACSYVYCGRSLTGSC